MSAFNMWYTKSVPVNSPARASQVRAQTKCFQ
jgi:hypothetical protein